MCRYPARIMISLDLYLLLHHLVSVRERFLGRMGHRDEPPQGFLVP